MSTLIETRSVDAGYGDTPIIVDLSLEVRAGEVVALLGANGAGKTTAMLAMAGVLPVMRGEVLIKGKPARGGLDARAREGLGLITADRAIFRDLCVADNLRLGRGTVDDAVALFPALGGLLRRKAGLLSGGEQQMLSLGRVLAGRPELLLVDELSLGLAPIIVQGLLRAIRAAADRGAGVLLVEQQVRLGLGVADRAYVLRQGRVELSGTATELRRSLVEIEQKYLGAAL